MIRFTNVPQFKAVLKAHPLYLKNVLRDVLVEVSIVTFESIVKGNQFGNPKGTPVQTGFARSSWYVESGPPTLQTMPRPAKGQWDKSGGGSLSAGTAVIVTSASLGVPLHFVNGAEYAVILEYGGSERQAPHGMVRLATANAQAILDSVVRRLK